MNSRDEYEFYNLTQYIIVMYETMLLRIYYTLQCSTIVYYAFVDKCASMVMLSRHHVLTLRVSSSWVQNVFVTQMTLL